MLYIIYIYGHNFLFQPCTPYASPACLPACLHVPCQLFTCLGYIPGSTTYTMQEENTTLCLHHLLLDSTYLLPTCSSPHLGLWVSSWFCSSACLPAGPGSLPTTIPSGRREVAIVSRAYYTSYSLHLGGSPGYWRRRRSVPAFSACLPLPGSLWKEEEEGF